MKKVADSCLSRDFVEGRIKEAFKKNKFCQSFELNCKFPRQAEQFYDYASKKTAVKSKMKADLREQICAHFEVESIDEIPCCELNNLNALFKRNTIHRCVS